MEVQEILGKEIVLYAKGRKDIDEVIGRLEPELRPRYLICGAEEWPDDRADPVRFDSLEAFLEWGGVKCTFVLIAENADKEIKEVSQKLSERKIPFDHVDFYITQRINARYLQLMGKYDYTDRQQNHILISPDAKPFRKCYIDRKETSEGNVIRIGDIAIMNVLYICPIGRRGTVVIGDHTTVQEARITVNSDGIVRLGEHCMVSTKVNIMQSDHHPIFDAHTGKRINHVKNVTVGEHVWLGRESALLPGANIGRNSVVAAYAVTSSTFPENVIVAGCPGKVIRTDIIWSRDRLREADYETIEESQDDAAKEYWRQMRTEDTDAI